MSQLERKQQFLITQVVEKGYDPNEFAEYLFGLKQGGDNINNWTFDELVKMVRFYKEKKSSFIHEKYDEEEEEEGVDLVGPVGPVGPIAGIEEQPQPQRDTVNTNANSETKIQQQVVSESKGNSDKPKPKVFYEKYNLDDRQMHNSMPCTQFKKFMDKAEGPITVSVTKHQIRTTGGFLGFGSTSKLWFTFKTNLTQGQVKRMDQDFEWLRQTLTRFYPGYILPHLRATKPIAQGQRKQLLQRMLEVKSFLEDLSLQPILFNNKLVISFLTWIDYQRFNQYKQQISVSSYHRIMPKLQTLSGNVEMQISEQNRRFVRGLQTYSGEVMESYNGLRNDVKEMLTNLEDLTLNVYKVANGFAEMQEKYSALVETSPKLENQTFSEILICLNNVFIQWGKTYEEQRRTLEQNLGSFFSSQRHQVNSIRELLQRRSDAQQDYLKYRSALLKRKQKLLPDPTKWEVPQNILNKIPEISKLSREEALSYILPRQSQQERKLKQWYAYLNKRCQSAFMEHLPIVSGNYVKTFRKLGCDLVGNTKAEIQALSRLSTGIVL